MEEDQSLLPSEPPAASLRSVPDAGGQSQGCVARVALFQRKTFRMHSGGVGSFKIECDALSNDDVETLAGVIADRFTFGNVYGVPRGGTRIAAALRKHQSAGPTLIVDDVLTTGASMVAARDLHPNSVGVVLFARGPTPEWVHPVFRMWPTASPPDGGAK